MAESNVVDMVLRVTPQGLELFDQAGKKVGEFGRAAVEAGKQGEGAFSRFGAKLVELNQSWELASKAANAAATAIQAVFAGVERGGAIDDLSQKIGVARETLSSFELAAKVSGVSLEGLGGSFKFLSKNLAEAASGNKELGSLFKQMGVDVQAGLKDSETAMLRIADVMASMPDSAQKTALSIALLGRSGAESLPFLNQGAEGIQKMKEASDALGASMSDAGVRMADAFGDNLDVIKTAVVGVQTQFTEGMLPALLELSEGAVDALKGLGIANGEIKQLGASVGEFIQQSVTPLLDAIREIGDRAKEVGLAQAFAEQEPRIVETLGNIGAAMLEKAARIGLDIGEKIADGIIESIDRNTSSFEVVGATIGAVVIGGLATALTKSTLVGGLFAQLGAKIGAELGDAFGGSLEEDIDRRINAAFENVDPAQGIASLSAALDRVRGMVAKGIGGEEAVSGVSALEDAMQQMSDKMALGAKTSRDAGNAADEAGKKAGGAAPNFKLGANAASDFADDLTKQAGALSASAPFFEAAARGAMSLAQAEQYAAAIQATYSKGLSDEASLQAALAVERARAAAEATKETAALVEAAAMTEERVAALDEAIAAGLSEAEAEELRAQAIIEAHAADILATTGSEQKADAYRRAAENARAQAQAEKERQAVLQAQNRTQDLQLELSLTQQVNQGLISQLDKKILIARAQADGNKALADELEKQVKIQDAIEDQQTAYLHLGDVFKDSFNQAFDAVISGTRDMGDVLEGIGIGIGKRFFSAMLDSKLKDFDPTVKANFLDLGEFGKSVFGDLFSGAGELSGGGSSGGGTGGSLLNLLTGGGGGAGSLVSLLGGAGGLLAGAGTGANYGTTGILTGLGATGAYSLFSKFAISNLGQDALALLGGETFAGTVGDFLGNAGTTWGGSLFGGANIAEGFGGGALGSIGSGLVSAGLNYGASVAGSATREALGVAGPYGTEGQILQTIGDVVVGIVGTYFGGPLLGALLVYINQILGPLSGELFGVAQPPTKGTMQRQAGESYLDAIPTFGNLQDSLGDVTRKFYRVEDAPWLPESREKLGPDTMRDIGGFAGIVAQIFGGEVDNGGRVAGMVEEWTNILTDFFGRMDQEGEETSLAIRQHLAQAFKEIGVDATDALEIVNKLAGNLLWSPGGTDTNYFGEEVSNVTNLGEAVRGTAAIFESEMPKGVHIAALALESMSRDGEKAFSDLDTTGHETLLNLADDAENFDAILAHLFEQGFTIDTEEFEARLKSITESAQFIGENIGQIFNFDNAAVGVEAIFQGLKQQVLGVFQQTSLDQLFKTTNIAAAFEPVYAALDRIDEFDLTTATGSQDFMNLLLPALAEGKANLQDYIPVLQLMADNWKEIQKIIDEAMKPDVFEQAAQVAEAGFNGIGGALTAAIEAGMVVLESGGTWDDAVSVFNNTFGAGVEKSFKDAIFNAIVQSAVIQPLIATFQPAFEYVVAAGLIYGFSDPRVKEAFGILMSQVNSQAQDLGLLVFEAKVDSDGITSGIEKAFNDAADITVDWADGLTNLVHTGLNAAFDVLAEGGSRDQALAAWGDALGSNTRDSVFRGIVLALIDAAIIEPFIKQWAPIIQFWTAGAIANGIDDPKVKQAADILFGPNSPFLQGLNNIGPISIDFYGRIIGYTDENGNPVDVGSGGATGGSTTSDGTYVTGWPGAANGGTFRPGSNFVVGEEGPEAVFYGSDGSLHVVPIDRPTMHSLLNSGVPGYAAGVGPGARPGDLAPRPPAPRNTYYPPGFYPRGGVPGDGLRRPWPDGPGAKSGLSIDVKVDLGLDEAIEAFLRGGSLKDFQDALDEGTKKAVLDGVIKGMLESGPIKNAIDAFNKQMDDAVTKAMRDGIIDAQDQADLAALSEKLSGGIETATKQMQPVVEAVGKAFGLGVEESTKEAIDGISSDLDGAIRTFLEGGSVTDMADEINRSVYDATTSAIIQALVTTGPLADVIDKFGSKVGKAISDALEDGTIDEKEARRIRRIGKKYGAEISDAIEALGPVLGPMFEQWAGELGLDLKGEIVSVEGLLGNAVRQGLLDGSSFDTFKQNVKQTLYEAIVDGMVQAFIDSAVINGLLAGPLGVINATFAQIADGQLTVAEANKIIFQQVGIITGLIDSPAFKAAWTVMTSGIDAIRASLGIATANVVDAAQGFTDVADAAQNACAGECEWERKLVEGQEKNATLDEYGRQGYEAVETYGPVKPGGDETDDPWADVPDTMGGGNGVYGHPSDLVGYWQRREMRKNRRRQRRLDGPSGPAWGEYPDDGDSTFGPVKYPRDDRDFVGPNAALQSGPMLVQDEGVAALRAEVASLRDAILNMPAPVVNLDGREISKNSRKHERRESRGAQSTQWGIS